MHSPTKVLMGATRSNIKEVDNRPGSIAAGLAVRLKSDDTITTAAADGALLGISLGRSLSDTGRTAIARKGLSVPIQLTSGFSPAIGDQVEIDDVTGKAKATGAGVTAVNATYVSEKLTMVDEDGNETADAVAYIDFQGGL